MKRPSGGLILIWLIALGVAGNLLWSTASRPQTVNRHPQELPETPLIETAPPARRDFQYTRSWMGRVVSQRSVRLRALAAGNIVSITAADATRVQKGDLLMQLGGPQVQHQLDSLNAAVDTWHERLPLARQRVTHKRQAVAEKIAAVDELLQVQDAQTVIEAGLRAAIEARQAFTDRLTLRAPFSGVLTQFQVSVGQEVETGAVLASLLDPAHQRIEATAFLDTSRPLRGLTAVVLPDTGSPLVATVVRVLPSRTPAGGTRLWIEGDAIDRVLHPGQRVRGHLRLATHSAALAVPRGALVYDAQETPYVFVQRGRDMVQQRVRTGLTSKGWIEILSGLSDTDQVVTQGAYELFYRNFNQVYKVAD
jgi:RND family efflux transporter MFP subunit